MAVYVSFRARDIRIKLEIETVRAANLTFRVHLHFSNVSSPAGTAKRASAGNPTAVAMHLDVCWLFPGVGEENEAVGPAGGGEWKTIMNTVCLMVACK